MKDIKYTVYIHAYKGSNKTYVGITHHKDPRKRWGSKGVRYNHSIKFMRAINKYGWDSFEHIVLCRTTKERAVLIERTLISAYKRKNLSYNTAEGGEGAESVSEETKKKLSMYTPWIKGRHHTEESRKLISEAGKKRGRRSEETKLKISKANMGHPYYKLTEEGRKVLIEKQNKPVLQFNKNGEFIREFSSAVEAERFLNAKGSHISCCCTGKRKTAYGYKWRFKNSNI